MDERTALLERIGELEAALSKRDGLLAEYEAEHAKKVEGIEERDAKIAKLEETVARLSQNVEALKRLLAGGSERRPREDSSIHEKQLLLAGILEGALRGPETEGGEETGVFHVAAHTRRRKGRRRRFPDHLPVLRTVIELDEEHRRCACGGHLEPMGEETSRELERVEFTLVHEVVRLKYSCPRCHEGVVTAPAPRRVIDKGLLGVGFLAHVLTERFLNHMPYHRQEKKYASEGLDLSRAVLGASAMRCAELLSPIVTQLRREILASDVVHTDDTPVTILEDSAGRRRRARIWIYRDLEGRCFFHFTENRSRDGPREILDGYRGYLVADAYPGYDHLFVPDGATEVGCWAHARRRYVEAEASEPELAKEAIARIAELYAIEKLARGMNPAERKALRERRSRPRLARLRNWLAAKREQVLDKGAMARGIDYTISNWDALTRYLEDGRLPMDNNAAERSLRCVAVGRKNWNFVGNRAGGETAAAMYSLVETCKAAGVDPREYFRDVLLRIATCSDVTKLVPHAWKEHFLPEVEKRRHDALRRLFPVA